MIKNDWYELLKDELSQNYFQELMIFLNLEYKNNTVYPAKTDIFNALNCTSFKNTRVVILGQDPYPGEEQAHGLCFSVKRGIAIPRSLMNIFKELQSDLGQTVPSHGCLEDWTRQGVLLLNTVLTVRSGEPRSHWGRGWELFTNRVIELINAKEDPVVFLLWGNDARTKKKLITNPRHLVLEAAHPSPLSASRGFLGCKHFTKANDFLNQHYGVKIDWKI